MRTKKQIKKIWDSLKAKYNNTYLDLKVITELNKEGIRIY